MARTYGDWSAFVEVSTLSSEVSLVIADASHGHAADSLSLTLQFALSIAEATHAHYADNVILNFEELITVLAKARSAGRQIQTAGRYNIQTAGRYNIQTNRR